MTAHVGGIIFGEPQCIRSLEMVFMAQPFTDVCANIRACTKCLKFAGKQQLKSFPLKPVAVFGPFQQWVLDFYGEIHPASSGQHK
jgi:hypothetical protein